MKQEELIAALEGFHHDLLTQERSIEEALKTALTNRGRIAQALVNLKLQEPQNEMLIHEHEVAIKALTHEIHTKNHLLVHTGQSRCRISQRLNAERAALLSAA